MLNEKLDAALNDQINAELHSAYIYLSMAAYFDSKNLGGFAHWMKAQVQEELAHAMKIYTFVNERGGRAVMKAIEGPPTEWASPLAAFEAAYKHEVYISGRINTLVDLATAESDHATTAFLQWFVNEQVEEEATADGVVQKLTMIGDNPQGLYMIDTELGSRVAPVAPTGGAGE
jgi:ferritin